MALDRRQSSLGPDNPEKIAEQQRRATNWIMRSKTYAWKEDLERHWGGRGIPPAGAKSQPPSTNGVGTLVSLGESWTHTKLR
jgi:hypothetical protein